MANAIAVFPGGWDAVRMVLPERFNWPLFCLALMLMSAPVMQIGWQLLKKTGSERVMNQAEADFNAGTA